QIMPDGGIDGGLGHGGHALMKLEEALRPRASFVVAVPIERCHEGQPLCSLEPNAMYVSDKCQERHDGLARARQSELVRLFGGVSHVAAGVRQCDNLCAGSLRLQQVCAEIGGVERMTRAA